MELHPIDFYLPQKRPFIMVDKIQSVSIQECQTEFNVLSQNIMVHDGELSESGLLENIAQTCATHIGYIEIHIRNAQYIRIGMVAQIKALDIKRYPRVGDLVITHVTEKENYGDVSIYDATMTIGEEEIAAGEFRVILTDKIN